MCDEKRDSAERWRTSAGSLGTAVVRASMWLFRQIGRETCSVKVVIDNLDRATAICNCPVHWRRLTEAQRKRLKQLVKEEVQWQIWQEHCNTALNLNFIYFGLRWESH